MSRTLLRNCADCGRSVRGRTRCTDCQRDYQRTQRQRHPDQEQAKRARRPDLYNNAAERERRRRVVADHRAIVGDWCPGWQGRPAHPSADLTADHVREVARGGHPNGVLVVRCRSCNAARSAHLARRALRALANNNGNVKGARRADYKRPARAQRPDQRFPPGGAPHDPAAQPKSRYEIAAPPYDDQGPGHRGPVVA
jgi:5-methylcytosine-specific restriction enzyme A